MEKSHNSIVITVTNEIHFYKKTTKIKLFSPAHLCLLFQCLIHSSRLLGGLELVLPGNEGRSNSTGMSSSDDPGSSPWLQERGLYFCKRKYIIKESE